jgi:hypothetical protein
MASGADNPNSTQAARANRLRLAKEDYARAMEDAQKEAISIRKNMARLKELRLAKEADTVRAQSAAGSDTETKPKKRSK